MKKKRFFLFNVYFFCIQIFIFLRGKNIVLRSGALFFEEKLLPYYKKINIECMHA